MNRQQSLVAKKLKPEVKHERRKLGSYGEEYEIEVIDGEEVVNIMYMKKYENKEARNQKV